MSFNIKKSESCFAVTHSEIERRVGRKLFDDKLPERCHQRRRKRAVARAVDPGRRDQRDRARLGTSQQIIKNQNTEEGIGRDYELQRNGVLRRSADSIQPVEIEIHCDASVLNDHLLKRPAVSFSTGICLRSRDRIRRPRPG